MSQQYVYDIKLSTGIAPKSLDPEGFPLVETKYIETEEGNRLSDKLTGIDNELLVIDQKIDVNRDELDNQITTINEHLDQTDANIAQEVTDRVNFGHAVNNELLKVNNRVDSINTIIGDVDSSLESTKVECKNYTDNKVAAEELERQSAIANEATLRSSGDTLLQSQLDSKVGVVIYNQDKSDINEAIRVINNELTSIPNIYSTKAEVLAVKGELDGKISVKLNTNQFETHIEEVDIKFGEVDTNINSIQQQVTNITQDYLKATDKSQLETLINDKLDIVDFNDYSSQTNSNINSLSNSISVLKDTVESNKNDCEEKLSNKANSSDVYTKTEINETVNSLQETVNNISSELDGTVKTAIKEEADRAIEAEATLNDKIDTKVDSTIYQNKIGELTTAISLKADITAVEVIDLQGKNNADDIVTINNLLENLENTKLDSSVYNADKETFALKSEIPSINHLATQDSVNSVSNDVQTLQNSVNSVSDDVQTLQNNVNSVSDDVQTLQNIVTELDSIVDTKVDQTYLDKEVSSLQTKISHAIDTAVGTVEPSIQANTSAISQKADKTELNDYALKADLTSKQDVIPFRTDATTGVSVGSLQANTNLKNMTLVDILKAMLSINVAVTGIQLSKSAVNLLPNTNVTITATVVPENASEQTVTWSLDKDSATLSATSGSSVVVTAGSNNDTVVVTATCSNVSAQCIINIVGQLSPSETIVTDELSMYVTDTDGNLVEVPFNVMEINEEDINNDASTSGFYQILDDSGNIVSQGYQSILPIYQSGPLTIALPDIITLNDITLYQYDALQSKWSIKDSNFLTQRATQDIDGYIIYEDVNNASQGEHFRFEINE